jgi:hypothetical protein
MKSHSRIRKTIKWGGLTVLMLFAAALVVSLFWRVERVQWRATGDTIGMFSLDQGCIYIFSSLGIDPSRTVHVEWSVQSSIDTFTLWQPRLWRNPDTLSVLVPLWLLALPLALVTGVAWTLDFRQRRRALRGQCLNCGYDRAGIAAMGACPECGVVPS